MLPAFAGGRLAAQVFLRGDTNGDGRASISDSKLTLNYLFQGGPAVTCDKAADLDGNGSINLTDAIRLLNTLFLGGPLPCEPYPQPGSGPTSETLSCAEYVVGPTLADEAAVMTVLGAIAGPDGVATLNLLVSSSRAVTGYSAVLALGGTEFGSVTRISELSGTLAGGFLSARPFGGKIHIGFVCSLIDVVSIPAGENQAVLQLEVCIAGGTAAGDYPLRLEAAELIDSITSKAILPRTVDDVLAVPVALPPGGCVSPPVPMPSRECALRDDVPDPVVPHGGPTLDFVRGDINLDGRVSMADALWLRGLIFAAGPVPPCADAADADDDGRINLGDMLFLLQRLYTSPDLLFPMPLPFPGPAPDPTADEFGCAADRVEPPPPPSTEVVRLGAAEGSQGGFIPVTVFLTNEVEVEALQLIVSFDPAKLTPLENQATFTQELIEATGGLQRGDTFFSIRGFPGEPGVLVIGFLPDLGASRFQIPPGQDRPLFSFGVQLAADLAAGSSVEIGWTDGPAGAGIGPFGLRNELSSFGRARLPRVEAGSILVSEARPFLRGDANGSGRVDISDSIFILSSLFLIGGIPACFDAFDATDDGRINITDPIAILNTLFIGLLQIRQPFPEPGVDPTPDDLPDCP